MSFRVSFHFLSHSASSSLIEFLTSGISSLEIFCLKMEKQNQQMVFEHLPSVRDTRSWIVVILPEDVEVLQHTGQLLTFLLQVLRTEVGLRDGTGPATLLPEDLQRVVRQLQHRQEVQLAGLVHVP